eukprot:scaffold8363_cov91-Isochrysis_galbana.AAC.2
MHCLLTLAPITRPPRPPSHPLYLCRLYFHPAAGTCETHALLSHDFRWCSPAGRDAGPLWPRIFLAASGSSAASAGTTTCAPASAKAASQKKRCARDGPEFCLFFTSAGTTTCATSLRWVARGARTPPPTGRHSHLFPPKSPLTRNPRPFECANCQAWSHTTPPSPTPCFHFGLPSRTEPACAPMGCGTCLVAPCSLQPAGPGQFCPPRPRRRCFSPPFIPCPPDLSPPLHSVGPRHSGGCRSAWHQVHIATRREHRLQKQNHRGQIRRPAPTRKVPGGARRTGRGPSTARHGPSHSPPSSPRLWHAVGADAGDG